MGRGEMAVGNGSTLVYILIIVFGMAAFGLSIAGERHRSTGTVKSDFGNEKYCVYESDAVASGYGVGACVLLLCTQVVLTVVTCCVCCGSQSAPGGSRTCSIVFFVISWISFIIAEGSLVAAMKDSSYGDGYGPMYAKGISCTTLRRTLFLDGAIFTASTTILNIFCYMCFTHASRKRIQQTDYPANSTVVMTPCG